MKASALMTPEPLTVSIDTQLSSAMLLMEEHGIRHLPVVSSDRRLMGVLSDRQLMKATGWLEPAVLQELELSGRCVRDVLQPMPLTVGPDAELREIADRLTHWGIGCTPVVEDGRVIGMITETDVMREFVESVREGKLSAEQDPPLSRTMKRRVRTIDPATPIEALADLFDTEDFRHLPVTDDDRLLGIVSDRDVRLAVGRGLPEDTPASQLMPAELYSLTPGATLSEAADLMVHHKISAVPVEEVGLLQGLVTSTDVLAHCAYVL